MRQVSPGRLALAVTVVPLVVSAVYLSVRHSDYAPIGDLASTELLTRDAGRHALTLGPFSRDGWFHPGPAMYYLLAVPYRLLGSTASAMNVGALLINALSVAGMALVARRRGGRPLLLITLVGCALLMRSLGPDELRMPWNPYITVLPYALLVFLAWAMTAGERWALPAGVAAASFVAQTHIGYLGLALPMLAAGVFWLVGEALVTARRERDRAVLRSLVAPAATAAATGIVMWLPPVVQQVTGDRGNLTAALEWFRGGGTYGEVPRGYLVGWRLASAQYGLPPEWLFGRRPLSPITLEANYLYDPLLPVLLVPVAAAVYLLWRWRDNAAVRLAAVWLVASVAGVVAVAGTLGPVYEYRIGWSSVLGTVAGILLAWAGWTAVARWRPEVEGRVLVPLAAVTLTVLAFVGAVAHVRAGRPQGAPTDRTAAVVPDVVDALPAGDGPVVIEPGGSLESAGYGPSLLLQLERRGIDARTTPGDHTVGDHRAHEGAPVRAHLLVATGDEIAVAASHPDATLLARDGVEASGGAPEQAADETFRLGEAALAVFLVEDRGEA